MHLALAGAVVAALAIAPRAEPAFPGANGEIAFSIVLPTSYEGAWLSDAQHFDFVLCTMSPAGGARQRITALAGNTLAGPAWSADGSRLVLMGGPSPRLRSWRMSMAAGRRSTSPSGRSPAWAPAGDRIAYGSREGLAVVNLVGGQPQDPRGSRGSARLVAGRHAHRLHRRRPARSHRSGRVGERRAHVRAGDSRFSELVAGR